MDGARFVSLRDELQQRGIAVDAVLQAIQAFTVETPSWGYGNSGTRFKVFPWAGAARTLLENSMTRPWSSASRALARALPFTSPGIRLMIGPVCRRTPPILGCASAR